MASLNVTPSWFTTSNGQPVDLITLRSRAGMEVDLISWGATLVSVRLPAGGGKGQAGGNTGAPALVDVLVGFANPSEWETNAPYLGSTVGRFANRIAFGRMRVAGEAVELDANLPPHHLHGGVNGFSHRLWEWSQTGDGAVTFTLTSPHGDQGYPGTLQASVTYTLDDAGTLAMDMRATTDAATHVSLTNHAYFNLAGRPADASAPTGSMPPVTDHLLEVAASRFTPIDELGIPTGELASVATTPLDFTHPRRVGDRIDSTHPSMASLGGYDHNLVLDDWDGTLRRAAVLTHPSSGRRLEVATTLPGLQVYTAGGLHVDGARWNTTCGPRSAICLEAQFFPDSPNQPHFPSTYLTPGEEWAHRITFTFKP